MERDIVWKVAQLPFLEKASGVDPLDVIVNDGSADLDEIEHMLISICQDYDIEARMLFNSLKIKFPTYTESRDIWKIWRKNRIKQYPYKVGDLVSILTELKR